MAFRQDYPKLMVKDMYGYFFEKYDSLPKKYTEIFEVRNSGSAFEQNTTALGMGKLSERLEGDDIVISNPLEGFTVYAKNRTFSDGFCFTMEIVEDTPPEKIENIVRSHAQTWGEMVGVTKEEYAAKFFNYGGYTAGHSTFNASIPGVLTDPSGDLVYDGKPFFNLSNNTRSSKGGGTYYNGLAVSLSSDNLQTAYNLMTSTNNRTERDERISLMPDILLIPPALKFTADDILKSTNVLGSANNNINPTQNLLTPVVWQYLTDTDAWFVGKAKAGLVWYERKQPVIDFFQDPNNKKFYATIDARWGAAVENWRYWVGSNFSTS